MYLSYIFRVCYEIYSGFTAAKVQLFCDICKRKGHFLSKKGKKTPKMSGYMNKKLYFSRNCFCSSAEREVKYAFHPGQKLMCHIKRYLKLLYRLLVCQAFVA